MSPSKGQLISKPIDGMLTSPDVGSSHVFRVIEQCCFNSVSDPFNG